MPPPGRHGHGGGWGHGPGRGWGGPFFPGRGLGGLVAGVATGAVIAAALTPPPRRRLPPPRAGYIYVVDSGVPVRAVRVEEAPFVVLRVNIPSVGNGDNGEMLYHLEVTMNDNYKYTIGRRYSQFDQLRARVAPLLQVVTPPFPPKQGMWRLGAVGIEERRSMLHAWLQSLITSAKMNSPALRLPLYDFLETTTYYPPEIPDAPATAASNPAIPVEAVPYATATPYAAAIHGDGVAPAATTASQAPREVNDGWGVPMWSREASDTKLAMAGPDKDGRLSAAIAAEALRAGTGAETVDLRAIWELADIDKDGKLDRDEFAVAWYLAQKAAGGVRPPASLPLDIIPPSKRQPMATSSANPF